MNAILERVKRNPVLVLDVVKAVLALLIVFGVPLPPGLDVALAGVVIAGLSLLTRSAVTPNATVDEKVEEALNTPAPEAVAVPGYVEGE
ncbi:hypothetical protein ACQPZJ_35475 [Actinoplanes sp. CA-054009]